MTPVTICPGETKSVPLDILKQGEWVEAGACEATCHSLDEISFTPLVRVFKGEIVRPRVIVVGVS